MSNQITVHYEDRDVTYKGLNEDAKFKFYMKSGLILTTPAEKMLSTSKEINRTILEPIVACFLKTFKNNSTITFGNLACTGNDVSKIEVCDDDEKMLLTVYNEGAN